MSKNILLVLSEKDNAPSLLRKILQQNTNKVFLCPIDYRASRLAERLNKSINEKKPGNAELVDFVGKFNQEAYQLKGEYINFIYDLGEKELINGKNLKEYFAYPKENFSVWWFSLIAERNPYKSSSFIFFTKINTILKLKKELSCQEIWISKNSRLVYDVLSKLKLQGVVSGSSNNRFLDGFITAKVLLIELPRVLRFILASFVETIALKKMKAEFKCHKEAIKNCDLALLTTFPLIDQKKLKQGKFVNLAYGSLQDAIEQSHNKKKIAWFGIFASVNSLKWPQVLPITRKIKKIERFFLVDEWLSLKDLGRIVSTYFFLAFRCLRYLGRYRAQFYYREATLGANLNLWPIFARDFLSSFCGKVLIWGLSDYWKFSNITQELLPKTKILYFAELHGWEKALNVACAQRKDVVCVGLQHASISSLWLNYFNHPTDLSGSDYVRYTPTPNYLGCVGSIARNIFLENGWPREKIFILGGFRFPSLKKTSSMTSVSQKKNQIVVALSLSPVANKEILLFIYDAFYNKNYSFDILFKCHPIDPLEKVAQKIGLDMTGNLRFTNQSLDEVVAESRAMIVKESSSVFWAINHNIPIIVPYLYSFVDICPLSEVSHLAHYVATPAELFDVAYEIMQDKKEINKTEYREFFNRYIEIYQTDERYYENLMSAINS